MQHYPSPKAVVLTGCDLSGSMQKGPFRAVPWGEHTHLLGFACSCAKWGAEINPNWEDPNLPLGAPPMYGHHPVTQEPFLNLTTAQPRGLSHLDLGGKGKEVQGGEGSRIRSLC